ncbi:helix-turn-helix domain-containing protein [Streptomyces sp. LHD-70]|uniref:PucR family transcriptional regulator n=1 Tax=Streptomyces sp. LHD-70 TaxID=3072140 RepID=UPI00280F30FB|nr:helix-turn-helix domain-containing protein [Streptomyces sp. LHD-70]MDQ8708099.1 helix-turn-helix domain-containing protein [Streptomyces sp. LHD-70]
MQQTDMQAVVDRLASSVGQSVLIEDIDQLPVWWSTTGAVDGARLKTILDRRVDPSAAAVVPRLRLRQATAPVHTPAIPEADMWARWCMPLRYEGRSLGLLWVLDPDGTITEADLPAIVECAELAAETLAEAQESARQRTRQRDDLIDRLLQGPDQDAARELARLENVPAEVQIQVEAPGRPGGWPLLDGMTAHVAGSRPRAAVSGAPLPLVELSEAVRRAAATLRCVAAGARLESVSWDALGAWRLVVEAPDSLTAEQLHPGIAVLATQPRDELIVTARVVLDHGGEVAAAAQELHVHRTTLYYRLNQVTELTGVDLRSGPARTNLQLALWLAAYRAAEG